MKRIKELLKPDIPADQNDKMPEIMLAIMPDYPKWNRLFFQLDCVFAIINFFLVCSFFISFLLGGTAEFSFSLLGIGYMLMPSVLNVIILLAAAILRKRLPEKDMRQNAVPVFTMLLLNIVVSIAPNIYFITLGVFCIPICMTTVYSDKKMCRIVTHISLGVVFITLIRQLMGEATSQERIVILSQGLIAICIIATMGIVAQTAVKMTNGQKQKLIQFAIDIKEEQSKAEAASKAKSAFLANMSHEIRTPINAILGMNEMILRENNNWQIEEYANNIHSAGNSLLYLVNDVLDISKIESGKMEIMENIYDVPSFIYDCYNMIAEKAEKKGLELKVSCNPQIPSQLRGDESRLRQVATNLLSNAAKYTQKGSITLSFDRRDNDGQMMLVIAVKDTGIGINAENLEHLFTQFTRFDMAKNRNIEGTGLGLALTKRLTDLMHGTIDVQSIYGVGSSFTVTVPQEIIDPAPVGDFYQKNLSTADRGGKYKQSFEAPDAKILVVDDVEVNLKVIVNLLRATKMKVDTASNGRQCLEMITQTKYDLIFMDHMMPEMSGVDTYAEMKKLENSLNMDTPVIMLTANAVTGIREQFLQEGFVDYLSKPVSSDKLENMILQYLPEGKYQKLNDDQKPEKETLFPEEIKRLLQLYPHVNVSKGLAACVDSYNVYIDVLKSYAKEAKTDKLNAYLEQKNASDYRILIHGIKSASISVGFFNLAERAFALENAANKYDWDFISTNHASFIQEYQQAASAIQEVFK